MVATAQEKQFQKEWFRHKLAAEQAKMTVVEQIKSGQGDALLLDARDQASYEQGHLPGAVSMPLAEVEARAGALDPQREHIVYCWHAT